MGCVLRAGGTEFAVDEFLADSPFEPLAGTRHVEVTQRRTNPDFARIMRRLVDE